MALWTDMNTPHKEAPSLVYKPNIIVKAQCGRDYLKTLLNPKKGEFCIQIKQNI